MHYVIVVKKPLNQLEVRKADKKIRDNKGWIIT